MLYRLALVLVTLLWVTMNYLLWRSEYGGRNEPGNVVPTEVVWRKILTAPDNSSLDVFHQGKKEGYCRWATIVSQAGAGNDAADPNGVEGRVALSAGYRLNVGGNLAVKDTTSRAHFDLELALNPQREWREFNLRINFQKNSLTIHSLAVDQSLHLRADAEGQIIDRNLRFTDLQSPQALMQAFALPLPLALAGMAQLPATTQTGPLPGLGLEWEARNDWVTIGHTSVRAYRLRAKLLDRYQILVLVSPVGEILRVELPDGWVLVNDQLGML